MHDKNSIFDVDSSSYPISLMLHDCITYDINMTLLWWMDVAKFLLVLLETYQVWLPLGLFQVLTILAFEWMSLNVCIFKVFDHKCRAPIS